MASITNLATLQVALADWVARTDLSTDILNNFIDLAEDEIIHGIYDESGRVIVPPLRVRPMEYRNPTFFLSGEFTSLPTGFLGFRAVKLIANPNVKLDYVTPAFFDGTYLSTDSTTQARAYTLEGGQLRVGPGATSSDTLDVVYYVKPDRLTLLNTNWICTSYPNSYLYGALRHLAVYCGMDGKVPFFQSAFIATLASLHASEQSTNFSGVALQSRPLGVTTT